MISTEQLDRIKEYKQGWTHDVGHGATLWDAPRYVSIASAYAFIDAINGLGIDHPPVFFSCDPWGIICAEMWKDPRKLTVYFDVNGNRYLKVWGTHMFNDMEDGQVASLKELVEWLIQ